MGLAYAASTQMPPIFEAPAVVAVDSTAPAFESADGQQDSPMATMNHSRRRSAVRMFLSDNAPAFATAGRASVAGTPAAIAISLPCESWTLTSDQRGGHRPRVAGRPKTETPTDPVNRMIGTRGWG